MAAVTPGGALHLMNCDTGEPEASFEMAIGTEDIAFDDMGRL